MKGAHRITKSRNGQRVETGSYIIQVSTRFPVCKRLQLTTSVYPETKNSVTIITEMKSMLREMNRKGDSDRFIQLRDKKVKLIDLYNAWKLGKEHLLYGNEGKGLLEELEAYRTSGIHSRYTETTTQRWLATFKKKGLLKDSHVVAELPQVVKSVQTYYSTKKKHAMFNLSRQYFLGFLKKHCGHSKESPLYLSVQRIESLKILAMKQHHPFTAPSDIFDLLTRINANTHIPAAKKQLYRDAILMMAFHPFRPSEFLQLKWEKDTATQHLRIKGTKTPQSVRVVPLMFYPTHYQTKHLGTYRLTESAINKVLATLGSLSRTRDFRRTWSIWAEKAGIERSHLLHYMGHKGRQQTDLYQVRVLTRSEVQEDCEKLMDWVKQQSQQPKQPVRAHWAPGTEDAAYETKQPNSGPLDF